MSAIAAAPDPAREALLARIGRDRDRLALSLRQLRQPLLALDRWRRTLQSLLIVLPAVLLACAAAWLLLRSRAPGGQVAQRATAAAGTWLPLLRQLLLAWRLAVQVQTLLRDRAAPAAPAAALPIR